MSFASLSTVGALLLAPHFLLAQNAAPAADPVIRDGRFQWFTLNETRAEVLKLLGQPATVSRFGDDFEAWQYRVGDIDHDDSSHYLVFRRSTGTLISITRTYEPERSVDAFFPADETKVYFAPLPAPSSYGARVRFSSGGRVLIAMGSTHPGQPASQILLIRESELPIFYRWISRQPARR